jgi:hypothetical protein
MRQKRIAEANRRARAISCLTRFFQKILAGRRVDMIISQKLQINWDPGEIVKPVIVDSCRKIKILARKWLIRKSGRFASAYADEVFETAFVHLAAKFQPADLKVRGH